MNISQRCVVRGLQKFSGSWYYIKSRGLAGMVITRTLEVCPVLLLLELQKSAGSSITRNVEVFRGLGIAWNLEVPQVWVLQGLCQVWVLLRFKNPAGSRKFMDSRISLSVESLCRNLGKCLTCLKITTLNWGFNNLGKGKTSSYNSKIP